VYDWVGMNGLFYKDVTWPKLQNLRLSWKIENRTIYKQIGNLYRFAVAKIDVSVLSEQFDIVSIFRSI
jgi:hypothetical protein